MFHGIDFATYYGVNLKIFSLSNQNDLTLPETIFELLISRQIMVRILQAFLPQLHGEHEYTQKLTFDTEIQCLVGSGFREISSRENDQ